MKVGDIVKVRVSNKYFRISRILPTGALLAVGLRNRFNQFWGVHHVKFDLEELEPVPEELVPLIELKYNLGGK